MKVPTNNIAKIKGVNGSNKEFSFSLDLREVKHIRRSLKLYQRIHPDEDDMTKNLINKWMMFGRRKGRSRKSSHSFMDNTEKKCTYEGCDKKTGLTVDHIIPLSAGGTSSHANLRILCRRHHDIVSYEYILERKKEEVRILKNKIEDLR